MFLNPLLFIEFSSVDTSDLIFQETTLQCESMLRAVGIRRADDDFSSIDYLIPHVFVGYRHTIDTVCKWRGVRCDDDGIVRLIYWKGNQKGGVSLAYLYLEWLPSTITDITINVQQRAKKERTFSTRLLPREIVNFYMQNCDLKGSVDLSQLPSKIRRFQMPFNSLSGTVFIGDLPRNLEVIDLISNPIHLVAVDNRLLVSDTFREALFSRGGKIRTFEVSGEKIDQRIEIRRLTSQRKMVKI